MASRVGEISKLGNRYQTTVPKGVRKHLNLGKGDRIRHSAEPGGRVYMEAEESTREDHAVGAFLDFPADDIEKHPERLKPIGGPLLDHARELVKNIEVDLDMPLSPDDE